MASITIRDVPKDVHKVLKVRAATAGQSVQEYLVATLRQVARQPTIEEVTKEVEKRLSTSSNTVTGAAILQALDEGRRERE